MTCSYAGRRMQPRSGGLLRKSRGGQCSNHLQDRCACAPALTTAARKLLQLAVRVIPVKALELFAHNFLRAR